MPVQSNWEAEASKLGYKSEEEMWKDLYPKHSLNELVVKFGRAINTIRARLEYFQIPKRQRGGANNQKVEIDQNLLNDVIALGVNAAAKKHNIRPQALYQRIYYKYGTSVKELKQKAREALAASQSTPQPEPSQEEAQDEKDRPFSNDLPK